MEIFRIIYLSILYIYVTSIVYNYLLYNWIIVSNPFNFAAGIGGAYFKDLFYVKRYLNP